MLWRHNFTFNPIFLIKIFVFVRILSFFWYKLTWIEKFAAFALWLLNKMIQCGANDMVQFHLIICSGVCLNFEFIIFFRIFSTWFTDSLHKTSLFLIHSCSNLWSYLKCMNSIIHRTLSATHNQLLQHRNQRQSKKCVHNVFPKQINWTPF